MLRKHVRNTCTGHSPGTRPCCRHGVRDAEIQKRFRDFAYKKFTVLGERLPNKL